MIKFSRLSFLLLLAGVLSFTACQKESVLPEDEEQKEETEIVNLLATIKANPNLTSLYTAITYAEMESTFEASKEYTFFAPDNDAFDTFLSKQNWSSITDASKSQMKSILEFHISDKGMVKSDDFTNGQTFRIMYGEYDVRLNLNDPAKPTAVLGLTNGVIVDKDIEATNGVMHRIDGVLSL